MSNNKIPAKTYGLRPVAIVDNELVNYTAVKAPEGMISHYWANKLIESLAELGTGPEHKGSDCLIDYLDDDHNILGEVMVSKSAFEHACKTWGCEVMEDEIYEPTKA